MEFCFLKILDLRILYSRAGGGLHSGSKYEKENSSEKYFVSHNTCVLCE